MTVYFNFFLCFRSLCVDAIWLCIFIDVDVRENIYHYSNLFSFVGLFVIYFVRFSTRMQYISSKASKMI